MACFIVPAAEAIVATVAKKTVAEKEEAQGLDASQSGLTAQGKFTWKKKLSWLTTMLWGGAILLCLEHIWHGEVIFNPPFLSAMASPADTAVMLQEMSTVGVGMAIAVTAVWAVMVLVADHVPAVKKTLSGSEA